MAGRLPRYPETDADRDAATGPDRASTTRPRSWLSVLGTILAVVLGALFVFLHLTGVIGPGAH